MDLSNLKKLRCERSLLQKDIAKYLGITVAAYSLYETGKRTPSIDVLKKLCKFYNIDMDLLLGWRKPEQYHVVYGNPFEDKEQSLTQEELDRRLKEEAARKALKFTDSDNGIYTDPNLQKLYEVAIEKAICHEELTEEEEQVVIGIPGQMRQKSDSYEGSYSFASSEEELNKILKQRQKQREELLLNDYRKLNELGQLEARKRVRELTEIPRYTTPPQE